MVLWMFLGEGCGYDTPIIRRVTEPVLIRFLVKSTLGDYFKTSAARSAESLLAQPLLAGPWVT